MGKQGKEKLKKFDANEIGHLFWTVGYL